MGSTFHLPDESIIHRLTQKYPCREHQIRTLAALVHPLAIPCRNIVLHGTEATGKSSITASLLSLLEESDEDDEDDDDARAHVRYAIVDSAQCITPRHLFETIAAEVAKAVDTRRYRGEPDGDGKHAHLRVETLAQLNLELSKLLKYVNRGRDWRFVLVLDRVDRQREAPLSMIPGLARLSEIMPCLTTIFILTAPPSSLLRTAATPHILFPPYSKSEFVKILSLSPPPPLKGTSQQETSDLWTRFCAAVHDSLVRPASRTLTSFRLTSRALWPKFVEPLLQGRYEVKEFSKMLVAARSHFQDESVLDRSIVSGSSFPVSKEGGEDEGEEREEREEEEREEKEEKKKEEKEERREARSLTTKQSNLTKLLPTTAKLLLLSAYLSSHNAPKHDVTLFSTTHTRQRRRRGGGTTAGTSRHRKIARKLLGAHAFVLERMMAIFEAVRNEWVGEQGAGRWGVDGDVGMAIATLSSLRLMVRVGGVGAGDNLLDRGGKWRVNVGWEVIRGLGRNMGVEVEEWLID